MLIVNNNSVGASVLINVKVMLNRFTELTKQNN